MFLPIPLILVVRNFSFMPGQFFFFPSRRHYQGNNVEFPRHLVIALLVPATAYLDLCGADILRNCAN